MANNRPHHPDPTRVIAADQPAKVTRDRVQPAERDAREAADGSDQMAEVGPLQRIAALSRIALERDDLGALMSDAVRHVAGELGVDHVQVSEFLTRERSFAFRAGTGWLLQALAEEELASALEPQAAFTVAAGEPVIVPELASERRFSVPHALRKNGAASSISVVIPAYPQVYGVLAAYAKERREFSANDSMFLRAIANVLAGAIQNDRGKRALQDRGARMAAVIDTALEGIVTIDERGIIESVNPAACRLFGYEPAELFGRNVNMLMPEPYHGEHDGYMLNYLRTGNARIIGIGREVSGLRKDGSVFPLHLGVSEFRVGGKRMFTGQVRDMTERRRLEREVLEIGSQEQMRIGHDLHDGLCQELTGVSFALEVLGKKLEARSAPETASIRKVAELIDQSISHARALAHGLQPVSLEATGLESALQELAAKTERLFRVSCLFVGEGTVLVHDNTVATHVYRIAQEAIGNAIKHGKAKTIMVDLAVHAGQLALTITDDGVGLSKVSAGGGKGIGLQTMAYRAGMVGGTLVVRPGERGAGTVVVCTVPLRQVEADRATPERASEDGGQTQADKRIAQAGRGGNQIARGDGGGDGSSSTGGGQGRAKAKGLHRRRPPDRPRAPRRIDRPGS